MARIFDVVEYPSEMTNELVHRFPEVGVADLRVGSQVIVRESQKQCSCAMVMRWTCSVRGGIPSSQPTFHI